LYGSVLVTFEEEMGCGTEGKGDNAGGPMGESACVGVVRSSINLGMAALGGVIAVRLILSSRGGGVFELRRGSTCAVVI